MKGEIAMSTQIENQDVLPTHWLDPFPEPHTLPSGWDLSGFFPDPRPAIAPEEDDSAESQTVNREGR
jgi:hypothetical protein